MERVPPLWVLLPHDRSTLEHLRSSLQVPPLIAQLLLNRGLREPESARHFLSAPYRGLRDPDLLPGVVQAAERLQAALRDGKKICVYGDYDVDGLTGTAILWQCLQLLGANVEFYVPHRLDEGYGLNLEALRQLAKNGVATVVTVDCGIASIAEAEEARRLGLELIVTDHHEFKETLPSADVLVHPRLPGTNYPFGELSGSGVAFKLAWALCQRASGTTKVTPQFREFLLDSVTLAALGMVADVVPLRDENRIFVRHGLKRLRETHSVGLNALLEVAGLREKASLGSGDIAFFLAPRLNAAGRLGCARLVVELLTTTSSPRAAELARFLDKQNQDRQQLERRILAQAREALDGAASDQAAAFVLDHPDWHIGVIGIVAGRLAEQFARPALLIAWHGESDIGQGSGRSVPGFALHEALQACGEGLISHGGHAAAAGFRIPRAVLPAFRERFCAYAASHFETRPSTPKLTLDAEVPLSVLTRPVVESLAQLEPFGASNPRPLLLAGPVQVAGTPRRIGNGERHLMFRVRQEGIEHRAIAFNLGERAEELMSADGWCCLVFTPSINEWQGRRDVQLEIRDFHPGKQARLAP